MFQDPYLLIKFKIKVRLFQLFFVFQFMVITLKFFQPKPLVIIKIIVNYSEQTNSGHSQEFLNRVKLCLRLLRFQDFCKTQELCQLLTLSSFFIKNTNKKTSGS